ncbi:MAG TPA: hypothetical protein VFJ82_01190, partial [Longimicrobium sp.]|nr:hypothetical protein [Longimicrobium sp.]
MQTTTQPLAVLKFSKTKDGTPVLSITRRDGSVAWQKQHAFFPVHDLTHYAIETTLGLRQAFWGMMADGWEFSDFGTPWPRGPMPNQEEALLAEVSAGAFDTVTRDAADAGSGAAALNAHLAEYCARHGAPPPRVITADEYARIRALRDELAARWYALGPREA